jgi:hypothetical protein
MVQQGSGMEQCTRRIKQAHQQLFSSMVNLSASYSIRMQDNFFYWDIGFQLMVWGTVGAGVGNSLVQLTIDGGSPNITSQASNGSAIYNVVYFETPLLIETYHTAVVTNLGSTANGSSEFELDRFSFESTDVTPLFAPPPTSSQTPQSVPSESTTAGASFAKSSSKSPLGAIAGSVIGTLVLVIILLSFFLWKRRKQKLSNGVAGGTF